MNTAAKHGTMFVLDKIYTRNSIKVKRSNVKAAGILKLESIS